MTGIGASEIGGVVGADGAWESSLTVWARKTGQLEKNAITPEYVELGNLLEPVIASLYSRRTGFELYEAGTLVHPTDPLRVATPDRLVKGQPRIVQIKKARTRKAWGEEGTDDIPENIVAQCQWELSVTDRDVADVPVLFWGSKLAIYRVYRDDELIGLLADRASKWWRDYVLTRTQPPPDGSSSSRETLGKLYPSVKSGLVPLVPANPSYETVFALARDYAQARDDESDAKKRKERNGQELKALIGDHEGFAAPWGTVINGMRAGSPKWKDIAQVFNPSPKLVKTHTTEAGRTLRVTLK